MLNRRRRNEEAEEDDSENWLVTYADIVTVLLCFFVLMLMISEPKLDKFEEVTQALASGFVPQTIETPYKEVYKEIQTSIKENGAIVDVAVEYTANGVFLDFNTARLFEGQSPLLRANKFPVLDALIASVKRAKIPKGYRVVVEGHTDDTPVQAGIIQSNWELSSLRAGAVARYLATHGIEPKKVRAIGYGEVQPKVPNADERGRAIEANKRINRRVIVRVER